MRSDKCSSATAFLILLFCFGGVAFMQSGATQSALAVTALRYAQTNVEEQSSMAYESNDAQHDLIWADFEIIFQIEINELHNLPPPAAVA